MLPGEAGVEWTVEVATPPAAEPVSLDEAKQHLRVTVPDEDALIGRCIAAARRWAEAFQGRAWVSRTYRLRLERFPSGARPIALPFPPLMAVNAISYIRQDGTVVTLSPSSYQVLTGEPAQVLPVNGWPSESLAPGLPVVVEYEAGYGDTSAVPEDFKAALLLILGALFENRQDEVTEGVPRPILFGARALLHPRRVYFEGPDAP